MSRDPKLEKLDGDALDQHTIERALVGVDAVIQTLGVSPTPELILSGTRLFSVATRILVDAMTTIKRLICVTGLGAGDSRGHGAPCTMLPCGYFSDAFTPTRMRRSASFAAAVSTGLIRRPIPQVRACPAESSNWQGLCLQLLMWRARASHLLRSDRI
jgi:hypothetical protein